MTRSITPVCAFDVLADGTPVPVAEHWPATVSQGAYRWLHFDLHDPAFAAWAAAHLPHAAAKALQQAETRPRCDAADGGMILNLRGVNLNPGADPEDMVSLRLWVADGLIVSARLRKVWALDAIRTEFQSGLAPASVGRFVARLAYGLTKRIETVSLGLEEETDTIEDHAFDPKGPRPKGLAELRQSIIKIRRFVRPQAEALRTLGAGAVWPLDDITRGELAETINRNQRSLEELDATADRLSLIQAHEDAQQAAALGRNTYVLSIVAAVFLPLGFLTGLFGINVGGMPLVDSANGFAVIALACVAIGALVVGLLRYLRWL